MDHGADTEAAERQQMFESGEMKFVILRLLKEKPRYGYEVIKALEEKMAGYYTPSAGTVYPTLQLLEDEGYVRVVETNGKKVYHITPEGERYLEEHRDLLDEIIDRVRETVRDFAGGGIGEVQGGLCPARGDHLQARLAPGPRRPGAQAGRRDPAEGGRRHRAGLADRPGVNRRTRLCSALHGCSG